MAHNGGRLIANFSASYGSQFAFLNAIHGSVTGLVAIGSSDNGWGRLINANQYPKQMPLGEGAYWTWGQTRIYGERRTLWDLYYPTQHTVSVVGNDVNLMEDVVGPGHKTYEIVEKAPFTDYGGKSSNCVLISVRVTAMSGSDWTGGVILCKRGNKALIDAGEIFDPLYLELFNYVEGSTRIPVGILRALNVVGTHANYARKFSHKHDLSDASYQSPLLDERYHCGIAAKTLNHYTVTDFPGSPREWTDGQVVQFWMPERPTYLKVISAVTGATTQFEVTAHGLTTGERVGLNQNSVTSPEWIAPFTTKNGATGLPSDFSVTVDDADHFTIVLDSTGFPQPSDLRLMPIITVAGGFLGEKRCWRQGLSHHYSSEFSEYKSGGNITGVYYAEFDAVMMGGDGNKNTIYPGWPPELMCALARKIGAHLWVPLPPYMEGAEQRLYLGALKAGLLGKGLWPITEVGNEEWNTSPAYVTQSLYFTSKAALRFGPDFMASSYGYGAATADMADNAAMVYGADIQYRLVQSFQAVSNHASNINRLQCPPLSAGNPALYPGNRVDWHAVAPYLEPNQLSSGAAYPGWIDALKDFVSGDTEAAFDWYKNELLDGSSGKDRQPLRVQMANTAIWVAGLADYPGRSGKGAQLVHYEFNCYVSATNLAKGFPAGGITVQNVVDFEYGFSQSYQCSRVWGLALAKFVNAGVAWTSIFELAGCHGNQHAWGVRDTSTVGSRPNPAWQAAMNFNTGYNYYIGDTRNP